MALEIKCDVKGVRRFQAAMRQLDSGLQRHVHRLLASWAADVKGMAKQLVPVRTGRLRSSIYAEVRDWVVRIGANATYALFVEFGTRYMQARPYLYPAIQAHLPRLEQIIREAIQVAKAEAGFR
ncbi:MAG: HK97 gp10 family phage protein [Candidatus Bathyarchaeia archaeon]